MAWFAAVVAVKCRFRGARLGTLMFGLGTKEVGEHGSRTCRKRGSSIGYFKSVEIGFVGLNSLFDIVPCVYYHVNCLRDRSP